ncbi:RNA polymerase sigma-70 factor [Pedobacter sp. MC2016-14]|uniref:RNA polymerase sigma factor n=1 Tax=Pedobacter sp. MC2016-14 TaxID=2897327 RepID=UPI001E2E89AB|nr:RNA polymerase sigma-70 factor [Pedobacter sp. MC2016-14]MCD0488184.1 RNA polymerase sigma-70 factor [Pedobacter sp. MC2016-14]
MSVKITVDAALLLRCRNRDQIAFKAVYNHYHRKVYQYAYSYLKNKEQSEEILQDTFLNIWANIEKLNEKLPFEPYLFTICHREVLDAFRKMATANKLKANLVKTNTEIDNHTENEILLSDLRRFSETAIAKLPKQQQAVFQLSKLEDLSYEEIAQRLNISKNTVKNHLIVALKTLRPQFERHGVVYGLLLFLLF